MAHVPDVEVGDTVGARPPTSEPSIELVYYQADVPSTSAHIVKGALRQLRP